MSQEKIIWTIGHSIHPIEKFINMLKDFKIEHLVDIRSYPGSKRLPHFNKEELEKSLKKNNIKYVHLSELGGRRTAKPDSHNTAWRVNAFRGYADYMETEDFKNAIIKLIKFAEKNRTAYMCAEALWWSCHRALVSDYLKINGWKVMHIMSETKSDEHPYTKPARIVDGKLDYSKDEEPTLFG